MATYKQLKEFQYIDKIEEMKKLLNLYKYQIKSLNYQISEKDKQINTLIYKLNINSNNEIEKKNSKENINEDMVNIADNYIKEDYNINCKEADGNKIIINNSSDIQNNEIQEEKEKSNDTKIFEEKYRELILKNKEYESIIKELKIKDKEANKEIKVLNQKLFEFQNKLNNNIVLIRMIKIMIKILFLLMIMKIQVKLIQMKQIAVLTVKESKIKIK